MIENTAKKIDKIANEKVEVDVGGSIVLMSKLQSRVVSVATALGKAGRAGMRAGNSIAKGMKKGIELSASLAKNLLKVGAGAVVGSGVIASETAEASKTAKGYGTDYNTVKAFQKGSADISTDNVLDLFEEVRNKVGLTKTALEKAIKDPTFDINKYDIGGYTENGKKKKAERLEEGTLDDFISTGVLQKVDKTFEGMTNKVKIFNKFSKMSANEQMMLFAKAVDLDKKYISSMDDFLSGESQRLFSQLRMQAKEADTTIEALINKRKKQSFIDDKDLKDIEKYDKSIKGLGNVIAQISQKATAGIGNIFEPYLTRLTNYIQANKEKITSFVDSVSSYVQRKMSDLENYFTGAKFFDDQGQFKGIENALRVVMEDVKVLFNTALQEIGAALKENFNTSFTEVTSIVENFANKVMQIMALLAVAFLAGGPIGVAVAGLGILIMANLDNILEGIAGWAKKAKDYIMEVFNLKDKASAEVNASNSKEVSKNATPVTEMKGVTPVSGLTPFTAGNTASTVNNATQNVTVNVSEAQNANDTASKVSDAINGSAHNMGKQLTQQQKPAI